MGIKQRPSRLSESPELLTLAKCVRLGTERHLALVGYFLRDINSAAEAVAEARLDGLMDNLVDALPTTDPVVAALRTLVHGDWRQRRGYLRQAADRALSEPWGLLALIVEEARDLAFSEGLSYAPLETTDDLLSRLAEGAQQPSGDELQALTIQHLRLRSYTRTVLAMRRGACRQGADRAGRPKQSQQERLPVWAEWTIPGATPSLQNRSILLCEGQEQVRRAIFELNDSKLAMELMASTRPMFTGEPADCLARLQLELAVMLQHNAPLSAAAYLHSALAGVSSLPTDVNQSLRLSLHHTLVRINTTQLCDSLLRGNLETLPRASDSKATNSKATNSKETNEWRRQSKETRQRAASHLLAAEPLYGLFATARQQAEYLWFRGRLELWRGYDVDAAIGQLRGAIEAFRELADAMTAQLIGSEMCCSLLVLGETAKGLELLPTIDPSGLATFRSQLDSEDQVPS